MEYVEVEKFFQNSVPVLARLESGQKRGIIRALSGGLSTVRCDDGEVVRGVPPKNLSLALREL